MPGPARQGLLHCECVIKVETRAVRRRIKEDMTKIDDKQTDLQRRSNKQTKDEIRRVHPHLSEAELEMMVQAGKKAAKPAYSLERAKVICP